MLMITICYKDLVTFCNKLTIETRPRLRRIASVKNEEPYVAIHHYGHGTNVTAKGPS